jgi:hypothetical protein
MSTYSLAHNEPSRKPKIGPIIATVCTHPVPKGEKKKKGMRKKEKEKKKLSFLSL